MSLLFTNILIGIGLSMDAFSLAIIYGTLNLSNRKIKYLSIIVGIFHFFMPMIGYFLGDTFLAKFILDPEILVGVIFTVIALQMLWSLKQEEEVNNLTGIFSLIVFGFSVSIDSFSVGIGIGTMRDKILPASIVFSLISGFFTYLGLTIGANLSKKYGKIATMIGSFILIGLAIHYFFMT